MLFAQKNLLTSAPAPQLLEIGKTHMENSHLHNPIDILGPFICLDFQKVLSPPPTLWAPWVSSSIVYFFVFLLESGITLYEKQINKCFVMLWKVNKCIVGSLFSPVFYYSIFHTSRKVKRSIQRIAINQLLKSHN